MGTVLIKRWNLRCVACGWRIGGRMFADTMGSYDVKKAAIEQHRREASERCSMDIGVEVEEAHDPVP